MKYKILDGLVLKTKTGLNFDFPRPILSASQKQKIMLSQHQEPCNRSRKTD